MEAGSEKSKVHGGSEKSKVHDGSETVEVQEVDFSEVIELPSESVTKQDEGTVAVEVTQAEEKIVVEKLGSSEASIEEKEVEKFSAVSEPEAPVKELVTEAKTLEEAALPISDTNVVESSGPDNSVSKDNAVHSSEPIPLPPPDATNGGGDRDVSENPSSTENQQADAVYTPHTPASWMNCCGLFDALRRSNQ